MGDEVLLDSAAEELEHNPCSSNGISNGLRGPRRCIYGRSCPECTKRRNAATGPDANSTMANVPSSENQPGSGELLQYGAVITARSAWIEDQMELTIDSAGTAVSASARESAVSTASNKSKTGADSDIAPTPSRWTSRGMA